MRQWPSVCLVPGFWERLLIHLSLCFYAPGVFLVALGMTPVEGVKAILAECTVLLRPEGVQIILKDEGVPFDMADENLSIRSLNAYTVSSYLQRTDLDDQHLIVMGYNRSTFLVKYDHH